MTLKVTLRRVGAAMSVSTVLSLLATTSAHAALPEAVTTAITTFQSDATSLINAGWPLLVAVFGGMILMKLFKKVGNKAT